jgi:hypothetical protein
MLRAQTVTIAMLRACETKPRRSFRLLPRGARGRRQTMRRQLAVRSARRYTLHTATQHVLHVLSFVDKAVAYDLNSSWVWRRTGYAGILPIAKLPGLSLISGLCDDRSTIHSLYDYE